MKVTKPCDLCGTRFELTAAQVASIGKSVPRHCGPRCRAKAEFQRRSAAQLRKHGPCRACGSEEMVGKQYGVVLCRLCKNLAWISCWRKVPQPTGEAAVNTFADGIPMVAYECDLCGHWHGTTRLTPVPADWAARRELVAAYFKADNFNIDERRGWSNADRFLPPGETP